MAAESRPASSNRSRVSSLAEDFIEQNLETMLKTPYKIHEALQQLELLLNRTDRLIESSEAKKKDVRQCAEIDAESLERAISRITAVVERIRVFQTANDGTGELGDEDPIPSDMYQQLTVNAEDTNDAQVDS